MLTLSFSRELIPRGRTGGLVIFQDRPNAFAWGKLSTYVRTISKFLWTDHDVDICHLDTAQHLEFSNVSVVTRGPLRAAVCAEVKYGQSAISIMVRRFMLMCV